MIMFGDSHGAAYAGGFEPVLTQNNVALGMVNGGCAPVLEYHKRNATKRDRQCSAMMTAKLQQVAEDKSIDTVVLAGQWGYYVYGQRYSSRQYIYSYAGQHNSDGANNPVEFAKAFTATVELLRKAGKRIVVIKSLPEYEFSVAEALAKVVWRGEQPVILDLPMAEYVVRNKDFEALLNSFDNDLVISIDAASYFCDDDQCRPYSVDLLPYYHDSNHLNELGLSLLASELLSEIGLLQPVAN